MRNDDLRCTVSVVGLGELLGSRSIWFLGLGFGGCRVEGRFL